MSLPEEQGNLERKNESLSVSQLIKYLFSVVFIPNRSLPHLFRDRNRVVYALVALLALGILYTLTVFVGYKNGFGAVMTPALNIPADQYYLWQTFFALPIFFVIYVVSAGAARLVSFSFKGSGSFEDLFSLYSLAMCLPMFITMWIPETLLIVFFPGHRLEPLGGFAVFPVWVDVLRQIIGIIWPLVIIVIGIKESEKLNWLVSGIVALVAFVPAAVLMLVFIR